jgi:ABC-2 type transport system ATP-binding protein
MILDIETSNLCKRYGSLVVVENLNLRVERGDIHALIGSNGAGKTKTLLILSDIIRPTSGSALVIGRDIERQQIEAKREIGYAPENPSLYESLTVREFLQFIGRLYSMPRDLAESKIKKYSQIWGIDSMARAPVS